MDKMTKLLIAGGIAFAVGIAAGNAFANDRYQSKGYIMVSPDLTAPWVTQLQNGQSGTIAGRPRSARPTQPGGIIVGQNPGKNYRRLSSKPYNPKPYSPVQNATVGAGQLRAVTGNNATARSAAEAEAMGHQIDAVWLPQTVDYETKQKQGSIIIDTNTKFLYYVLGDGKARRYGVGVGKPGFEWAGTHKVSRKTEWPDWRPPAEMIAREAKKGRKLPAFMEGGAENPLGARAMYLGSSLYRIHGTNQPWTIGQAVSSGCIRMRNEDVVDLYERVKVGAKVTVI
jgi:lipoprotein-anchoring transpeptidase ErfK/SrfK